MGIFLDDLKSFYEQYGSCISVTGYVSGCFRVNNEPQQVCRVSPWQLKLCIVVRSMSSINQGSAIFYGGYVADDWSG